jgi:hypothetical protein
MNKTSKKIMEKVLNRKHPKGIAHTRVRKNGKIYSKEAFCWYYNNQFVFMKRHRDEKGRLLPATKLVEDVLYVKKARKQTRSYPPFESIGYEVHAMERILDRDFTKEEVYETILNGHPLNCSDRNTARNKYVLDDVEVLVDESDMENPIVIQMHRNSRCEDQGFIDLLPKIISEIAEITKSSFYDVDIKCHNKTRFLEKLASDLDMHTAWQALQNIELMGKRHGWTLEQSAGVQKMRNTFASTWGHSVDWALSSKPPKDWHYGKSGDFNDSLGIPEGWLPSTRTNYYLQFQIHHYESETPTRILEILEEYGLKPGNRCRIQYLGNRAVDQHGRHLTKVTFLPCSPNHWAISEKHLNNRKRR